LVQGNVEIGMVSICKKTNMWGPQHGGLDVGQMGGVRQGGHGGGQ